MNRYPLWKYLLILVIISLGALYALPNIYGQSQVVQIKSEQDVAIEQATLDKVATVLNDNQVAYDAITIDGETAIVKFADLDAQRRGQDALKEGLNGFDTAMNLRPNVPEWLKGLGGKAMNLGLDLRGGVHFLLEVDMQEAAENKRKQIRSDITSLLIKSKVPKKRISWTGNELNIQFRNEADMQKALGLVEKDFDELSLRENVGVDTFEIKGLLSEQSMNAVKENALNQNLTTLRDRVNEIGVAEPIIQRQGLERIVVQLPGLQDTTQAKIMLDATATLEYRATHSYDGAAQQTYATGRTPPGTSLYFETDGRPIYLNNRVIATGNQLTDAQATFDQQSGTPAVSVKLNSVGAARMLEFTKNNVGNFMGVVFKERIPVGKNEEGVMQYKNKEVVINN